MGYFILDQNHNVLTPNCDLPAVLGRDEGLLGTEVVRVGVKSLEQRELATIFTPKSPNSPLFTPVLTPATMLAAVCTGKDRGLELSVGCRRYTASYVTSASIYNQLSQGAEEPRLSARVG